MPDLSLFCFLHTCGLTTDIKETQKVLGCKCWIRNVGHEIENREDEHEEGGRVLLKDTLIPSGINWLLVYR